MSADTVAAPVRPARPPFADPAFCGFAWALLVSCLALLVTGVVVGERVSTYDALRYDVARHGVYSTVVTGGMADAYVGRQTVTVHWREGARHYQAQVVEQHPLRWRVTPRGLPVVYSVERDLAALDPAVTVERQPHDFPDYYEFYGWRLPHWIGVAAGVLGLGVLMLLMSGPAPRAATRWAWFWVMSAVPPVGVIAFLVMSGHLSPRPRPDPRWRLTGGWAFLLAFFVGGAIKAGAGIVL